MADKKKTAQEELLEEIRERYKLAQDNETEVANRKSFLEDTKFENGEMWDEEAKKEREEFGRPCIEINKTAPVCNQILNDAKQNKISIKVKPVDNKNDPKIAQIFDGLINNIENVSSADNAYYTALGFSVRGGWGYFRALTKYSDEDSFEQDISIERITNPLSVYDDPKCQRLDRSDRKWAFIVDTVPRKDHEKKYPKGKCASGINESLGDYEKTWIDNKTVREAEYFRIVEEPDILYMLEEGQRTIRYSQVKENNHAIIEEETRPGKKEKYLLIGNNRFNIIKERKTKRPKVEWYKTNGVEILEGPKVWAGKYIPLFFVPGDEVWIEGKQILRSAIKWAKDPNRLYNWARSTSVETMSMAPRQPWILTKDEIKGFETMWSVANKQPLPYLLFNQKANGSRPQRQMGTVPDAGADREAMLASDDIKATTGKYDASLGAAGNETSGKAINARQQQGDIATFVFIDNLVAALEHLGKALVDLIPKIYDTERVVRLLNEDGSEQWETINKHVYDPVNDESIVLNDISVGKFDVVVTAGPAYATKRQEAIDGMVAMGQALPIAVPVLAPEIARNSDWPNADGIAKRLSQVTGVPLLGDEEEEQQPPPGNEEQVDPKEQLDVMKKTLDIEGKELLNQDRKNKLAQDSGELQTMVDGRIVQALQGLGLIPEELGVPGDENNTP